MFEIISSVLVIDDLTHIIDNVILEHIQIKQNYTHEYVSLLKIR